MLVLNKTSLYHEGSAEVMRNLYKLGEKHLISDNKVLVNGEGTLHNDTERCFKLLEKAKILKEEGKKVYLINSVWQNNRKAKAYLKYFDKIFVRESFSQKSLQDQGYDAKVVPDLSLYITKKEKPVKKKHKVIFIDSVQDETADYLNMLSKQFNAPFYRMCESPNIIEEIRSSEKVCTGRFHGLTFCIKYNIPFVAFDSNTHKIKGLVFDYHKDYLKEAQTKIEDMFKEIKND
jgi:hypothetical protein